MDYQDIIFTLEDNNIGVITLNRQEDRNALTTLMRGEITHAVAQAPRLGARVLVITGQGDVFCTGQDLGTQPSVAHLDLEGVLREETEPMLREIYGSSIPTIAAVNGTAAGIGASLALAADIVIAKEGAEFVQAFSRLGLIPEGGSTWILPRQVGLARAMGAALLGEAISAKKAADWGMILEATAKSRFEARVRDVAEKMGNGPTEAYRLTKDAIRSSFENSLDDQLDLEGASQGAAAQTFDFKEALFAFLEKRPPRFEGR
ncbi:MAG: enoyl-CoA hydratase-related protein [Pseudomonadota bacterium]